MPSDPIANIGRPLLEAIALVHWRMVQAQLRGEDELAEAYRKAIEEMRDELAKGQST